MWRRPAAPGPRTFLLGRGRRGALAVLLTAAGLASGFFAVVHLPRLFIPVSLVTTAFGLSRLFGGHPRALHLQGDAVHLDRLLRRRVTFFQSAATTQLLPDEIVWVTPAGTYAVARDDFDDGDFEACVEHFSRSPWRASDERRPPQRP